jgi:hypothetical protein
MEAQRHDMSSLFAQLGLPAEPTAVDGFIAEHGNLPGGIPLSEAPFWTPAQAAFLNDGILGDADWAEVIEALNGELHAPTRG